MRELEGLKIEAETERIDDSWNVEVDQLEKKIKEQTDLGGTKLRTL